MKTKTIALHAILVSLAMVLSYFERLLMLGIPMPLPGMKLGLSNIVSLTAMYLLGGRSAYVILLIRCVLGSVFSGSITGLMFSLAGGSLAMLIMIPASRAPWFSVYGVSILGAAAHSIGQIAVAMVLMNSVHIGAYLPYLLFTALPAGFATGTAAAGVLKIVSKNHYGL